MVYYLDKEKKDFESIREFLFPSKNTYIFSENNCPNYDSKVSSSGKLNLQKLVPTREMN